MEKFRLSIYVVLLLIAGVLVYSLSKSLFMLDRGIRVKEQTSKKDKEPAPPVKKNDSGFEDARVIFGKYLYYAIDPGFESGGYGPEEVQSRAKNLVFINIKNGRVKKLFRENVYIHDFFPGTFTRKMERGYNEPEEESLDAGNKIIILAVVNDTNDDGFLNHKDEKKVFVYDPDSESLAKVLPGNYYFEKLFYNTRKNQLAFLVKKVPPKTEKQANEPENNLYYYVYNVSGNRGKLVSPVQ